VVEEALAAVSRVVEEDPWISPIRSLRTLAELAPHLSEPARSEVLAKVLAAAREDYNGESEFAYLRASVALARHLPESPARARLIADILSDARDTPTEEERPWSLIEFASSLIELAPLLVGLQRADVLAEALAAARKIKRPEDYVRAVAALVPHLPDAQRADVLAEALVAAESIESEQKRAEALTELAAQLEEPGRTQVFAEALVAVRQIPGEADRARVLMALIERLPPRLLRQALGAAREIRSPQGRHELLMALAARLAEPDRSEVLAEALAAARQIEDPAVRAYKLAGMVGELPEPLRSQVIAETLSLLLGDPVAPRVVPDSFLLHLPPHQRSEVAAHVLVASFDQEPHIWLPLVNPRKLVPHLLAEQSPTVFDGFARYLRARCQAGRPAILRRLDAAVIEYLGGAAAIEQTARAVADVGQWWP
jgi:ribosomal protein L17